MIETLLFFFSILTPQDILISMFGGIVMGFLMARAPEFGSRIKRELYPETARRIMLWDALVTVAFVLPVGMNRFIISGGNPAILGFILVVWGAFVLFHILSYIWFKKRSITKYEEEQDG